MIIIIIMVIVIMIIIFIVMQQRAIQTNNKVLPALPNMKQTTCRMKPKQPSCFKQQNKQAHIQSNKR